MHSAGFSVFTCPLTVQSWKALPSVYEYLVEFLFSGKNVRILLVRIWRARETWTTLTFSHIHSAYSSLSGRTYCNYNFYVSNNWIRDFLYLKCWLILVCTTLNKIKSKIKLYRIFTWKYEPHLLDCIQVPPPLSYWQKNITWRWENVWGRRAFLRNFTRDRWAFLSQNIYPVGETKTTPVRCIMSSARVVPL